jgi:hypothetical protein
MLLFGTEATPMAEEVFQYKGINLTDSEDYLQNKRDTLAFVRAAARDEINKASAKMRSEQIKREKEEDRLKIGELVMLKLHHAHHKGLSNKLKVRWNGPFEVTENDNHPSITIESRYDAKKIRKLAHASQLKRFEGKLEPGFSGPHVVTNGDPPLIPPPEEEETDALVGTPPAIIPGPALRRSNRLHRPNPKYTNDYRA